MPEWKFAPRDANYWNPPNKGLNVHSARYLCVQYKTVTDFDSVCPDCGSTEAVMATSTGLPGVFCAACNSGQFHWDCPKCGTRQKTLDCFQYDSSLMSLARLR